MQHAADRYRFPAPAHACAGSGLHAVHHGGVRAQVTVIGRDPGRGCRATRVRFGHGCLVIDGPAGHAGARLRPP
jgi:hypothetical protein